MLLNELRDGQVFMRLNREDDVRVFMKDGLSVYHIGNLEDGNFKPTLTQSVLFALSSKVRPISLGAIEEETPRKFVLIESDLAPNGDEIPIERKFQSYEQLEIWLSDEHYEQGGLKAWVTIPCDDNDVMLLSEHKLEQVKIAIWG